MKYYEYDEADNFLVGWYESDKPRPLSTETPPDGVAPNRARWNGSAWIEDGSREAQIATKQQGDNAKEKGAIDACLAYDPETATDGDVRIALGAALFLLSRVTREMQGEA